MVTRSSALASTQRQAIRKSPTNTQRQSPFSPGFPPSTMEGFAPSSASSIHDSGAIGIGSALNPNTLIDWGGDSTASRGILPNSGSETSIANSLGMAITNRTPCRSYLVDTPTTRRGRNAEACKSSKQQALCCGESATVLDAAALQDRLLRSLKIDLGGRPQVPFSVGGGSRGRAGSRRRKRYHTIPLTPIGPNPYTWIRVICTFTSSMAYI